MIAYPLVVLSSEMRTPSLSASREIAICFTCAKLFPLTIILTNSRCFQCKCMFCTVPSKTSRLPVNFFLVNRCRSADVHIMNSILQLHSEKASVIPSIKKALIFRPILRNKKRSSSVTVSKSVGSSAGERNS